MRKTSEQLSILVKEAEKRDVDWKKCSDECQTERPTCRGLEKKTVVVIFVRECRKPVGSRQSLACLPVFVLVLVSAARLPCLSFVSDVTLEGLFKYI